VAFVYKATFTLWDNHGTNSVNSFVPSGMYFYRVSGGHDVQIGKLTLIK